MSLVSGVKQLVKHDWVQKQLRIMGDTYEFKTCRRCGAEMRRWKGNWTREFKDDIAVTSKVWRDCALMLVRKVLSK